MACRYVCPKLGTRVRTTGTRVRNSHFLLFHAFWSVFMKKHTSPRANGAQTTPHAHTSEPCAPNATHGLRARLRGQWHVPITIIIIHNHTTSPAPRRRLCSLRSPGGFHERYEGAKGTGNDGGGGPARAEQRQPPGGTSTAAAGSLTSTLLDVPSTAGSQRRRPNARWAAVGEASEASRDADVTVANAHAQRHGCLSARWAQTCARRAKGTTHPKIGVLKVRN